MLITMLNPKNATVTGTNVRATGGGIDVSDVLNALSDANASQLHDAIVRLYMLNDRGSHAMAVHQVSMCIRAYLIADGMPSVISSKCKGCNSIHHHDYVAMAVTVAVTELCYPHDVQPFSRDARASLAGISSGLATQYNLCRWVDAVISFINIEYNYIYQQVKININK